MTRIYDIKNIIFIQINYEYKVQRTNILAIAVISKSSLFYITLSTNQNVFILINIFSLMSQQYNTYSFIRKEKDFSQLNLWR